MIYTIRKQGYFFYTFSLLAYGNFEATINVAGSINKNSWPKAHLSNGKKAQYK